MSLRLLPFVEQLVIDYLLSVDEVETLVDEEIGTQLRANPSMPAIRLTRIGGRERVPLHLDGARLQIEAWADSQTTAWQVISTVRAAVAVMHEASHDLGVVTGTSIVLGPIWEPDPTTKKPRYLMDVLVFVHPHRS